MYIVLRLSRAGGGWKSDYASLSREKRSKVVIEVDTHVYFDTWSDPVRCECHGSRLFVYHRSTLDERGSDEVLSSTCGLKLSFKFEPVGSGCGLVEPVQSNGTFEYSSRAVVGLVDLEVDPVSSVTVVCHDEVATH
ncbi:hypothetical protein RYH80_09930 [Halobaculum sp. MBLA0147]|uniref:hypothetical protein n=1 Tax=Halobaculum sp. MBLA0147 TaxID=3079934 RepID=UPI00352392AB